MTPILRTLAGSLAYGTNVDTSDRDERGVYVLPIDAYLDFRKHDTHIEAKQPIDSMMWDIRRFIELGANGNPNVIETLFCDDVLQMSMAGEYLRHRRAAFLSRRVVTAFIEMAYGQTLRIKEVGGRKNWKFVMHGLRTARMAHEILTEGKVNVKRTWDADFLRSIRNGEVDLMSVQREIYNTYEFVNRTEGALPMKPDCDELNRIMITCIRAAQ